MFVLLAGKAGERKTFECPIYALSIYSMLLLLLAQYKHLDSKLLLCKIRQSTIWYAGLLGRWDKWLVDQASDGPSINFFSMNLQKWK